MTGESEFPTLRITTTEKIIRSYLSVLNIGATSNIFSDAGSFR